MKFICTKENLLNGLTVTNGVTSKVTNLPILSNILIRVTESKVELIATNLEIAIRVHLRAKVDQEGEFTAPAKTLADFINLLPNEQITIAREDNELVVTCGNSHTRIKGETADDFPVIPEFEQTHAYTLDVDELHAGLTKTLIASARNEIRPELAGVYCGFFTERYKGLVLAATDSYRLAEKKVKVSQGEDPLTCIMPGNTVGELIRLLSVGKKTSGESNVRMWVSSNQVSVRYGSFEMTSRLVEGNYPDYAQIIPTVFRSNVQVPLDEFIKTVKAASLFSVAGVNAVNVVADAQKKMLIVSSTSAQTGQHSSEIDVDIDGDSNDTLLNFRYVLDGLQHMQGEKVTIGLNSNDAPCVISETGEDGYQYIVMPIRQ